MSFYSSYFSGDSQLTALAAGIALNTADQAVVATYSAAATGYLSAVATAEAAALTTPNSTTLNALRDAYQNRATLVDPNGRAAGIGNLAVGGTSGTIMVRTVSLVQDALTDAISKLQAAVNSIGFTGSVTVSNAALRDSLSVQIRVAQGYLADSSSWKLPGDFSPAVTWLTA